MCLHTSYLYIYPRQHVYSSTVIDAKYVTYLFLQLVFKQLRKQIDNNEISWALGAMFDWFGRHKDNVDAAAPAAR